MSRATLFECRMIPLKRLDVQWSDLGYAAAACLRPLNRLRLQRDIADAWQQPDTLVCLSVRSGFDALLSLLALPEGSEVLVSAVTIPDMIRVIEAHGLVPVPVDIDPDTLAPDKASLHRAYASRSKMVLVAHLFGARARMDETLAFAQARGLLCVEDCAQAFRGADYHGDPRADVSMFSFGPIKTATALGGALLRVGDPLLRHRLGSALNAYPRQSRAAFLKRVVVWGALKLTECFPLMPYLLMALARWKKMEPDDVLAGWFKAFRDADLLAQLRYQPPLPMLALLLRRLKRFAGVGPRAARGLSARRALSSAVYLPGERAIAPTFWMFPVAVEDTRAACRALRAAGFWAGRGSGSMRVIAAPPERPETTAVQAQALLESLVCLPVHAWMSQRAYAKLIRCVHNLPRPAADAGRRQALNA